MNMSLLSPQDHKFPSLVAKVALKSKRKLIDNLWYEVLLGIKIKLWATYLSLLSGLIHWASRIIRPTSNWQRPLFRESGQSSHSRKRSNEYLMKMNECKRTISALGILIFSILFQPVPFVHHQSVLLPGHCEVHWDLQHLQQMVSPLFDRSKSPFRIYDIFCSEYKEYSEQNIWYILSRIYNILCPPGRNPWPLRSLWWKRWRKGSSSAPQAACL